MIRSTRRGGKKRKIKEREFQKTPPLVASLHVVRSSIRPALRSAVPAVFFQFSQQGLVERARVTGNVLAHVVQLAHPRDRSTHRGMRQNKAQRHLRQSHSRG